MARPHRLYDLRNLLRDRRWRTALELAGHLKCSEKTVMRHVAHLRDTEGWPIDAGKLGYRLRDPEIRGEITVSAFEEIAAVAMAQEALRLLGDSEMGVFLRASLQQVCRDSDDLHDLRWNELRELVQRHTRGEAAVDQGIQGHLTLAILQRLPVEIRYRRLEEEQSYACHVFPHRLVHRDHCWYLLAHDLERGGQKVYALPRISEVTQQPKPGDFVEPEYEDRGNDAFGIWSAYDSNAPLHDVCVELTGYWARIAKERRWHASQRLEALSPDHVRVHFRVNELVQVKTWVLGFGGAAKVIAPVELEQLVRTELEAMNRHYA